MNNAARPVENPVETDRRVVDLLKPVIGFIHLNSKPYRVIDIVNGPSSYSLLFYKIIVRTAL